MWNWSRSARYSLKQEIKGSLARTENKQRRSNRARIEKRMSTPARTIWRRGKGNFERRGGGRWGIFGGGKGISDLGFGEEGGERGLYIEREGYLWNKSFVR
jgi:hypothetical protein